MRRSGCELEESDKSRKRSDHDPIKLARVKRVKGRESDNEDMREDNEDGREK